MNDDHLKRFRRAHLDLGGRRLKYDDPSWVSALSKAIDIHADVQAMYRDPTFEDLQHPGIRLKRPHQYVDGYCVVVPYRTIIDIETTLAESSLLAEELTKLCEEITDDVMRERHLKRLEIVKESVKRRARAHLSLVP